MSLDLLFSVLPREGKVPIAHDSQKVEQVQKQDALRALNDEEKELKGEEREARQKQQQNASKEKKPAQQQEASDDSQDNNVENKKKGPGHLDIYV